MGTGYLFPSSLEGARKPLSKAAGKFGGFFYKMTEQRRRCQKTQSLNCCW